MPTGHFETERAEIETPVEEVRDFDFLIEEIRVATRDEAFERMPEWVDRFQAGWTNETDQWASLVDLMPRPRDVEPKLAEFRKHLLSATRPVEACDLFLIHPAVAPSLSSYAFTEFLGTYALDFVAGCLNLARAAVQAGAASSTVMGTLSNAIANYGTTLVGIGLHDPGFVVATDDGCSVADALDVPRERFARWSLERSQGELRSLMETFEAEKILEVMGALLGQTRISASTVAPIIRIALEAGDEPKPAAWVTTFAFESPDLSSVLKDRYAAANGTKPEALTRWARYVSRADAFRFGWECVKPDGGPEDPAPLGDAIEERLARFQDLLRIPKAPGDLADVSADRDWQWREPTLRALCAIGMLAARKWKEREDQLVCEDDAIAALEANPDLLAQSIEGILESCQPHWDVLDALILRLPRAMSVPALEDYVARASVWSEARHHAARLLAQAKGEPAAPPETEEAAPPQAMSDAESLIPAGRERKPLVSAQTWLGDPAIEKLWHVALQLAGRQFMQALSSRAEASERELCTELAEGLARALNGTNAAIRSWFRNGVKPLTVQASVRTLPEKMKRPGGGLQGDLAFLVQARIAGKCTTKRITILRAKRLGSVTDPATAEFRFHVNDRTQLARLLTISPSTHYLFMHPGESGAALRVMPAALVRDVFSLQRVGGGISLRTVRQAGVRLPEFVMFHVMGLWTGDDDKDLIAKAESDDPAERPNVVLEITISQD